MTMEKNGKEIIRMVKGMEKAHTLILIKRNMLENILMMNVMEKVLCPTLMGKNT